MEQGVSTTLIVAGGVMVAVSILGLGYGIKQTIPDVQDSSVGRISRTMDGLDAVTESNSDVTFDFNDYDNTASANGLNKATGVISIPRKVIHKGQIYTVTGVSKLAQNGENITSVSLPNTIESIESGAFNDTNITSITIPDSVTSIGSASFAGNKQLTQVVIGSGLTSIPASAFAESPITNLTLGKNVASIGANAFRNNHITNLNVPDSVTSIKNGAFVTQNQAVMQVSIGKNLTVTDPSTIFGYTNTAVVTTRK